MQAINVLSLFDGCSGGNQALEMSKIKVNNYFACEIDKYAIKVTQSNYPNTIQLGDVTKVNVKTLYLSEVYSYICNKYINNELYSLQSYISEQEMLHRINEEQAFSAYFGTQEQGKNSEVSTNTLLSINDRIWFWKYPMGGDKGVYDIIRSGSRRKVTNKIDVGVLCEYSFWWNGNGQYQSRIKEESFFGSNRIEKIGNNKTEDSRSSNKTIFNSSIERKSEIVSNRIIQRPIKKTKLFEWDGKCKQGAEVDKKEGNGRAKKASSICKNEGNIQANYEVNGVIEIDRVLVSIYSDVQVTIIECEWGIVIFKGVLELCCGGSPCQSFSFAGKRKGMSTKDETEILTLEHYLQLKSESFEFEGQSYLFWEYMRLLNELRVANPDVKFLLENVEMGEKWEKVLSKAIGVNGIHINSALLTAQNRKRIYWTNIGMVHSGLFAHLESIIQQPKDKKIVLKDILENEVDEKYFLSEKAITGILNHKKEQKEKGTGFGAVIKNENEKMNSLKVGGHGVDDLIIHNMMPRSSKTGKGGTGHLSRNDGKTYCLDTGNTNALEIKCVAMRGGGNDNLQQLEERIRRLTPLECERLQGMKDNYTEFCLDSYLLYICKETNAIKLCQQNVKFKDANQVSLINQQVSATSITCDSLEQEQLIRKLLTLVQNVNIMDAIKIKKLSKDIALLTIKDGLDMEHLNCQKNYLNETKNVNIVIEKLERKEEDQGGCVISIIKTGLDMETLYTQILKGVKLKQEGIMVKLMVKSDTGLLWRIQSEETLNLEKLFIILTLIKQIIVSKIYTYSKVKTNIKCATYNLKESGQNYLKMELLDLKMESISLNSDSQRYKMIGNGWTIPVISHLFNYIK